MIKKILLSALCMTIFAKLILFPIFARHQKIQQNLETLNESFKIMTKKNLDLGNKKQKELIIDSELSPKIITDTDEKIRAKLIQISSLSAEIENQKIHICINGSRDQK